MGIRMRKQVTVEKVEESVSGSEIVMKEESIPVISSGESESTPAGEIRSKAVAELLQNEFPTIEPKGDFMMAVKREDNKTPEVTSIEEEDEALEYSLLQYTRDITTSDATLRSLALVLQGAEWPSALLVGEPGTGKTTIAERLRHIIIPTCREGKLPAYIIACTGSTDSSEFKGALRIDDNGATYVTETALIRAVRDGGIFVLDEVNRLNPDEQSIFHPLLDRRRTLTIETKEGSVDISVSPDCIIIGTMNPPGSEGTQALTEALKDRFTTIQQVGYLTKNEERKQALASAYEDIIRYKRAIKERGGKIKEFTKMKEEKLKKALLCERGQMEPDEETKIFFDDLNKFIDIVNLLRDARKIGEISEVYTTRQVVNFCTMYWVRGTSAKALEMEGEVMPVSDVVRTLLVDRVGDEQERNVVVNLIYTKIDWTNPEIAKRWDITGLMRSIPEEKKNGNQTEKSS